MLNDLNWLSPGQIFPPASEQERLNKYEKNKQLFRGKQSEVYKKIFDRLNRENGNIENVFPNPLVINYQKMLSTKIADLVIGEHPEITSNNLQEQATIEAIIKDSNLMNTLYNSIIDITRYGDGLLYIRKDNVLNKVIIDVAQPSTWFKIVDRSNINIVINHVIAYVYEEWDKQFLLAKIHYPGKYEERKYLMENGKIKQLVEEPKTYTTGINDFAIIQLPNIMPSDSEYGIDDYNDLDSIVSEILIRISQVCKILDKHADPTMAGPMSAIEQIEGTDTWRFKVGNYIVRSSEQDPKPEYITYESQLQSSFEIIKLLIEQLISISEMSKVIIDGDNAGNATSGTALKLKMIPTLVKTRRIANMITHPLIRAIKLCSTLDNRYTNLINSNIEIEWKDGLPSLNEDNLDMNEPDVVIPKTENNIIEDPNINEDM